MSYQKKLFSSAGVPASDTRVRLFLRSKHIFVKLYANHHSWSVVEASQFIRNASRDDVRDRFGTELPWFQLCVKKSPSTFGTSVLSVPVIVLVLNGLLLVHNWDTEAHYIVCALSLIFFAGLHTITSLWISPSSTLPWFSELQLQLVTDKSIIFHAITTNLLT